MPTPYELDLTAAQVNEAVNAAYDTTGPVLGGSTKLVQGGAVYNAIVAQIRALAGWGEWADSTYTSGSPLTVTTARTQVLNDALGATTETTYLPTGVTTFWDPITNTITPDAVGDAYDMRFDFKAKPNGSATALAMYLDIGTGGSPIDLVERTISLPLGGENVISIGFPFFSLTTFLANKGKLMLAANASTVNVYDIEIFIKRNFSAIT